MTYIHWLVWGGILVVTEIFVGTFVLLWFGLGAFAAGLLCWLKFPAWIQWTAFAAIGLILFLLFRKAPFLLGKGAGVKFGSDRLVGQKGVVTKSIGKNSAGQIKAEGELWLAAADEEIAEGDTVTIERIEGTKAIVKKEETGE